MFMNWYELLIFYKSMILLQYFIDQLFYYVQSQYVLTGWWRDDKTPWCLQCMTDNCIISYNEGKIVADRRWVAFIHPHTAPAVRLAVSVSGWVLTLINHDMDIATYYSALHWER